MEIRLKRKYKVLTVIGISFLALILAAIIAIGGFFINFSVGRPQNEEFLPASSRISGEWLEDVNIRDVSVISDDNLKLAGIEYIVDEASTKWAIVLHGYHSDCTSMSSYAEVYCSRGYNVLTPDLRAHGASEGSYIGMGWLDRLDMLRWIDHVNENYPHSTIVLHGVSMGAATVMMTSGEELPDNVVAMIEDCGYTSVYDIFEYQLDEQFGLPPFPIMQISSFFNSLLVGYDYNEASCVKQLEKCKTPMLFIHGEKDTFVPYDMLFNVYNACSSEKALCVIENAPHAMSALIDPDNYWLHVFQFIGKYQPSIEKILE